MSQIYILYFLQVPKGFIKKSKNAEAEPSPASKIIQLNSPPKIYRHVFFDQQQYQLTETKSPIMADFIISYATNPGYVSWRNSQNGTWFIQSICRVFSEFACKEDIASMLTRVS